MTPLVCYIFLAAASDRRRATGAHRCALGGGAATTAARTANADGPRARAARSRARLLSRARWTGVRLHDRRRRAARDDRNKKRASEAASEVVGAKPSTDTWPEPIGIRATDVWGVMLPI